MNFGKKVRVKTPYGVKIFKNFYFQNTSSIILKRLAKKKSIFRWVGECCWVVGSGEKTFKDVVWFSTATRCTRSSEQRRTRKHGHQISCFWKFFHPYNKDGGGLFLEVKIMEIFDPILGFQPNFFFKIHQSLVIS